MSKITFKGNPVNTSGTLPSTGTKAPAFTLVGADLSDISLEMFKGKKVVLNIFPSIDTSVCATSVRKFNAKVSEMNNAVVLCISADLPFAQSRFCGAEGLQNVITVSVFRNQNFGKDYGLVMVDGPLTGLLSRALVIIDENGVVVSSQLVPEIAQEPDYEIAMKAVQS
jgi:thiol peroxidase